MDFFYLKYRNRLRHQYALFTAASYTFFSFPHCPLAGARKAIFRRFTSNKATVKPTNGFGLELAWQRVLKVDLGESLTARTESLSTFRELGPPDLCHVVKSTGKTGQRDLGSYHFVSGVDASSSASLAAYINSLTYAIEVRNGCYCCFNAFSRVDFRVDVKIPEGVNAYVVDLRGERHEATADMWQETYVSALLRAILYSDDPTHSLDAYRKLDPITSPEGELRFLAAAEALFLKGWQVGSDPEIQVASVTTNHLTAGLLKYFGTSGRYQQAANLFEKISVREPEVNSLLARAYLGMHEEVKALQIMSNALRTAPGPASYTLLHAQCDFLREKGPARQAVNAAPSEFVTWEKLTEVYVELGMFESVGQGAAHLNSFPMFTFNGRDAHRQLTPSRVHLPFHPLHRADPALQRLPRPGCAAPGRAPTASSRGSSAQIGWDELLKTRSAVFVMEEEYRMQKAQGDFATAGSGSPGGHARGESESAEGTTLAEGEGETDDEGDNASTRAMVSPGGSAVSATTSPVSVIGTGGEVNGNGNAAPTGGEWDPDDSDLDESDRDEMSVKTAVNTLEKPVQAAAGDEEDITGADKDKKGKEPASPLPQEPFSFSNKRLCERWLDNLFMVLYEDLRVWTIFRAEVAHFKTQHVAYRKTGLEWEILGDLGMRLHHKEEAKEAYQRCLDTPRYSVKPWSKLMEMYADEGDIQRSIQTAIRVAAYQYAEYTEMTFPTQIAQCFFKLGQVHGHAKISYHAPQHGLPEPILKIMDSYLQYGKTFKVEGYDF
ncbi:Chs5p-Arf1p-binding proteins-domain-containing protein [Mycena alexandri]|uniref:Chs5p-Arf1p-binding proteins-domain-containing protein n=1 Tax=Mycena alexandri TaxID=1745969 RepID=A0AAD6X340_9AGAR|nr:Chs5p-Arf1p-binding proteins-domain-containing protein [Mycena alexandri]